MDVCWGTEASSGGTVLPYGFDEVSKIGSAIERAAETLDLGGARRQAQLLGGCIYSSGCKFGQSLTYGH